MKNFELLLSDSEGLKGEENILAGFGIYIYIYVYKYILQRGYLS